jgi:hypothetical protein
MGGWALRCRQVLFQGNDGRGLERKGPLEVKIRSIWYTNRQLRRRSSCFVFVGHGDGCL